MSFTFQQGNLPKLDLKLDCGSEFMVWHVQWESYKNQLGLVKGSVTKKYKPLHYVSCGKPCQLSRILVLLKNREKVSTKLYVLLSATLMATPTDKTDKRQNF